MEIVFSLAYRVEKLKFVGVSGQFEFHKRKKKRKIDGGFMFGGTMFESFLYLKWLEVGFKKSKKNN